MKIHTDFSSDSSCNKFTPNQASKANDNDLVKKIKPMADRKQNIGLDPLKNKDLRANVNTGNTDAELQASKIFAKTKGKPGKWTNS